MIPITEFDLRRILPNNSYTRGRDYWSRNRVNDLKSERLSNGETLVMARVKGSGRNVYSVSITLSEDRSGIVIEGDCSCPVGWQCKHIAATLFALVEEQKQQAQSKSTLKKSFNQFIEQQDVQPDWVKKLMHNQATNNAKNDADLDSALEIWINRLTHTVDSPRAPRSPSTCVLYLLNLTHNTIGRMELEIRVVHTRILKNGGYGKTYPLTNLDSTHNNEDDDILLPWLAALKNSSHLRLGVYEFYNIPADEFLRQLIASGRCHWHDKDRPPLTLGEAVSATPTWQVENDGNQRLAYTFSSPIDFMLPLAPPWYIDLKSNICGPLDIGDIPPKLAALLTEAPVLPPQQAKALSERLGDGSLPIPKPKALQKIQRSKVKAVPHLYLFNQTLRAHRDSYLLDFDNDEAELPMARLSFIYQGKKLPAWPESQEPVTFYDDSSGELVEIPRDSKTEAAARNRMEKIGLVPLTEFYLFPSLDVSEDQSYDLLVVPLVDEEDDNVIHNALLRLSVRIVPQLRAEGWEVDMAEDYFFNVVEPELIDEWYAEVDEGSGIDWFGLELGVSIDGERTNLLPLLVDMLHDMPSVEVMRDLSEMPDDALLTPRMPDGRILPLPLGRVRHIFETLVELFDQEPLDEDGRLRLETLRAAQLAELEAAIGAAQMRWFGGERLLELGRKLQNFQGVQSVPVPDNFQADLRPYQQEGLNWLQFLREYKLGGILADDMGLGKTVQTLAHILSEKNSGRADKPSLVIAPTSLMVNWRMEAERFAPNLNVLTLHGPDRKNDFDKIPAHDLVLTTYPLLSRDKEALLDNEFHLLVLDEAQNIKNPKAKATQLVHQIKAEHRLCLTGTPMENHLGELWSLCHFLMPGLLGDATSFKQLFRTPIEKEGDYHRRETLARRIKPFMLRRTKQEVVTELPEKNEILRSVELEGAQLDLYETIRLTMHDKVRKEIASKGMARSQIVILDALLKLRQVCCDPRLVKLDSAKKVKSSAKLNLLMDLLPEMVEEGRKILLFSQFTSMLALIEEELAKHKIDYVKLTGQTRKRGEAIQAFQEGDVPLFLISLKAGGTGLNLTAADTVIHYDPWWNPAVENQATDRAHRIGQDKKVFVYKLITANTVEEKIQELQKRKQEIANALFTGKSNQAAKLSQNDLDALFEPLG
jgi:superfamily II DNA or RNA helicase